MLGLTKRKGRTDRKPDHEKVPLLPRRNPVPTRNAYFLLTRRIFFNAWAG
jgi:hypothetical protein